MYVTVGHVFGAPTCNISCATPNCLFHGVWERMAKPRIYCTQSRSTFCSFCASERDSTSLYVYVLCIATCLLCGSPQFSCHTTVHSHYCRHKRGRDEAMTTTMIFTTLAPCSTSTPTLRSSLIATIIGNAALQEVNNSFYTTKKREPSHTITHTSPRARVSSND